MIELKKFRNKYDLELIPASKSDITVGTLIWDPLVGKPQFAHPGMPNHIFNAFIDAKLLTKKEYLKSLKEVEIIEFVDAGFAESTINIDVDTVTTLENPQIGKINNNFELKNVKKFTFGDLKARCMSNLLRVKIDDYLEELKKNKWDLYDGKIRRVYMITELYYGSIKLVIDSKLKDDFNAAISKAHLKIENSAELGKSAEYTFTHQNVPFAMRIEKVKEFNA